MRRNAVSATLAVLFAGLALPALSGAGQPVAYVDVARVVQESKLGQLTRREYAALFEGEEVLLARRLDELRGLRDTPPSKVFNASSQMQTHYDMVVQGRHVADAGSRLRIAETRVRREHFERIQAAMRAAVEKLAEQRGLQFVLEDAVSIRPNLDLTSAVIVEMNGSSAR